MATEAETVPLSKRRLIIHDSVAFLSLILITIALLIVTLFLFRSFEAHRAELARRWSDRGKAALQQDKPEQAIAAFRTALSYAPSERSYEMMLAQALGEAGRNEESYNYFVGLWELRPGDGFINLQLARLAAKQHQVPSAVNSYHAAIYGTWEGDGVERRREVRLELARYLIAQHEFNPARTELRIAGGNAPDAPATDIILATLLEQAAAPQDALNYFQKALAQEPKSEVALSGGGRLAYSMGDYALARKLLERELSNHASDESEPAKQDDAALLARAERILQLIPANGLPARERVARILTARVIARQRLDACEALPGDAASTLQPLHAQWTSSDAIAKPRVLLADPDKQDAVLHLVYETELETSKACPDPAGDDALLLLLAQAAQSKAP